jgi:hypothetical protein
VFSYERGIGAQACHRALLRVLARPVPSDMQLSGAQAMTQTDAFGNLKKVTVVG